MSSTTAFTVPELTPVGHLGKPHGVRGELAAYLTIELETLCSDPSREAFYLFAEIDALPVPYQLLSYRSKGDSYLLTLAHVADRSIAEQMTGWRLFIPTELLAESEVAYSWDHFIGYQVLTPEGEPVGTILEVNDQTENILLTIETSDGTQHLIPIHEELVETIDPESRTIQLHIPQGLLDL